MKACGYCNKSIAAGAVVCPFCGHPQSSFEPGPLEGSSLEPSFPDVSTAAYAGFWRRALAFLIDAILIGVAGSVLGFGSWRPPGPEPSGTHFNFYMNTGGSIIAFIYPWLMIALVRGQTLGKMALKIRIATPTGGPVDLGQSAIRAGMSIVSALALGLGYLWAAWDPQNRTWHDMVAGTRAFRLNDPG